MPSAKTLLLFGPGAMTLDRSYFGNILSFIKDDAASRWTLQAIEDVETFWDLLCESVPKLRQTSGVSHARQLAGWLRTGLITPDSSVASLPNAILGPLVVIAQLVEYLRHVDSLTQSGLGDGRGFLALSREHAESVGCCLGVFSALVVSSSPSWTAWTHNAAAVLRTVFVLGALSDAQDVVDAAGPSVSLIAAWRRGQDLRKALDRFPEAYASVLYDDNRATVTASTRTVAALKAHLEAAGLTVSDTEFHGRFHAGALYETDLEAWFSFARKFPAFQLPEASCLVLPTRVNSERVISGQENLLEAAARAFLVQQFDWIRTFRSAVSSSLQERSSRVIEFGPERCVPPTLLRRLSSQITHFDFEASTLSDSAAGASGSAAMSGVGENEIAVIGMACNVAGAQDAEQYWKILLEGKSQHRELLPNGRFVMETPFRPSEEGDEKKRWYGNFIADHDAFDYKFFKKSPREVLHMDPQQRLILQTAYQAVAQSGYYHKSSLDSRVGCYIGLVANDYENNISHATPNAFSATGALRSYVAGKVSHFFGWTGPGMTVDTACSASTVAMDLAVKAIQSGECSAALVGGTNFYTTPMFFQNLAAGSFLSTTGQCKPFDANADGYCRGEAIGAVFVKKLSNAIADGDQILGVISATAINQNHNATPIFVPNPHSLTDVFRTVIAKAGVDPGDISVVEAHGTGTAVGDPAEYDSIRQVLGGAARAGKKPLQIGSVKGLIGHTEGASGVVALIKVLLMLQEGRIPPQASFNTINPAIKASPADNMEITKTAIPWEGESKAALLNNYGAAGSNASMVIRQAPKQVTGAVRDDALTSPSSSFKIPFFLTGLDDKSIQAYAARLRHSIKSKDVSGGRLGIENLAFNINRQANWSLGRALVFTADSIDDLDEKLASPETFATPASRPVVLCFGGQVSKSVGLDRALYDKAAVLRRHLDRCDAVCRSIGAGSILPAIFQREPIDDPSVLQPLLFAMQYASAMSWLDAGVEPAALVGHSFGELTALCVSGVLSLEDALKMIHGRSQTIRDAWGSERGSMMAVEADLADVESVLAITNTRLSQGGGTDEASIACFNGPRSFTLAGSVAAIDAVQLEISTRDASLPALKHKRLDVTNAFHSSLVEHLKPELEELGRELKFGQPKIPIERATKERETGTLSAAYVAEHMRQPVYFNHAVQRLAEQYPSAIFLEAGSNSTITAMASRALGMPRTSVFQGVNVTSTSPALQQLADATTNLWKAGLRVDFWPHSRAQTYEYAPIILPPYQFEKQRQWLEFKPPQKQVIIQEVVRTEKAAVEVEAPPTGLFTVLTKGENTSRFRINTGVKQFVDVVSGHVFAKAAATTPATFQIDIAIQALASIRPELADARRLYPQICNVVNQSALFADPSRAVTLSFERLGSHDEGWNFKFTSSLAGAGETTHLTGQLYFQPVDDARSGLEFGRFERLVTHERALRALDSTHDADDVIQGPSVYRVFSHIVELSERFTGIQKLVGRRNESAGRVVRRRPGESWLDSSLAEAFGLVGGIWVNCMARSPRSTDDTVFASIGFEQWMRSPDLLKTLSEGSPNDARKEWHVLAQHKRVNGGDSFISDLFVFDAASGSLEEVVLGIKYIPVPIASVLAGFSAPAAPAVAVAAPVQHVRIAAEPRAAPVGAPAPKFVPTLDNLPAPQASQTLQTPQIKVQKPPRARKNVKAELWVKLLPVLADISGLEPEEINESDSLADIGIDSLMGMEMAREVEKTFNCSFEKSELFSIVDVPGVLGFVQATLGLQDGEEYESDTDTASSGVVFSEDGSYPSSNPVTPFTPYEVVDDSVEEKGYFDQTLDLQPSAVLEAFRESKAQTDHLLKVRGVAGYMDGVAQKQTRLCLVLTHQAFRELGCDLAAAKAGDVLTPVPVVDRHKRFHQYLYHMLEETRIIDIDGDVITRTAIPLPSQSAEAILEDLMKHHADNGASHQLTYNVGSHMADVLSGRADGPALIFGDAKNREHVSQFYGELPFNKLFFEQMADVLGRLAAKLSPNTTLKILEMGAGTGGTTKVLVPYLAKLGIPLEYTFTDLSPSLVAQAKRKFKQYPFMKFAVHDIEQPPPAGADLTGTQHVVIASNAVHATHSLNVSTTNIRKFLRPDGFLMLLEMMKTLHWVDIVWGTLEGWWLFDDGRTHAINDEKLWERELLGAGYKHVEWTDGKLPENGVQKVLIALAADAGEDAVRPAAPADDDHEPTHEEKKIRRAAADDYVKKTARGFSIPQYSGPTVNSSAKAVLLTGATGSLGSHIAAHLASLPDVDAIYCLNRNGGPTRGARAAEYDPRQRQLKALESRGIQLDAVTLAKLHVIETDSAKPQLGLDATRYGQLLSCVTHIVHNAFPVNGLRSLEQNEPQFATMRNLIDLAASVSARREASDFKFTFQFISSLSAVGKYPSSHPGQTAVPEAHFDVDSALPNGYGAAKVICERVLHETLGRIPDRFRAHTARLGQISGSEKSGYWNHMEVLGFLFKSAQTLRSFPDAKGELSWLSLEQATSALGELLLLDHAGREVYHVDNPDHRRWEEIVPIWTRELGIPRTGVVPLREWIRRVRAYPGEEVWDNPAYQALEFFENKFEHMSCGGVTMETTNAKRDSGALRGARALGDDVVGKYVARWKETGFLRAS